MITTSVKDLTIEHISGNCPVQAEGTIAGHAFYFRARGNNWMFLVGTFDKPLYMIRQDYGTHEFDAGWMTEDEAKSFIEQAADQYIKLFK